MATPKQSKRTARLIKIRLSQAEAETVDARFIARGSAVRFARALLLDQPTLPRVSPERKLAGEVSRQLAWAGNNINQITRNLHTAKLAGSTLDAVLLAGQLTIIAAHLEEIQTTHTEEAKS
jgi:hypothetical protein